MGLIGRLGEVGGVEGDSREWWYARGENGIEMVVVSMKLSFGCS